MYIFVSLIIVCLGSLVKLTVACNFNLIWQRFIYVRRQFILKEKKGYNSKLNLGNG